MPTATLDDYLLRLQPYAPKPQAPVQLPQAQQINPLQLMVAQQLMSALQPQRSVTPKVPKNSMWITPQMIQGAAQTNVAEQRLGQEDQAMAQSQMAQMLQNQMAQERMGLERAQLQNQLNQPGAAEQAKLHMVGQILANEMMVNRQAAMQDEILNRQMEAEKQKRELPLTEQEKASLDYIKALTGQVGARGGGAAGGWTKYEIIQAINAGLMTREEGQRLLAQQGLAAPPASLGEEMQGWFAPKSPKERTVEANATIAEQKAKTATQPKKAGYEGFKDEAIQREWPTMKNAYITPPEEGTPERAVYDSLRAELLKRFGNAEAAPTEANKKKRTAAELFAP